jgi:hypothetical protein
VYWIKKRSKSRANGTRFAKPLLALALALALAGLICAQAALADTRPPASNAAVSEAYGAPLISNRQARTVPFGITPGQLVKRLHGESWNAQNYARGRVWKICITYPVKGTGVRDPRFGVIADEWLFCFGFDNKLKRKFFWDS